MPKIKAQIISGNFGEVVARQKSSENIEIGELLISDAKGGKILFQVYDLRYASQLSQQNLEMIAGMNLEEERVELFEPHMRNYMIAVLKALVKIKDNEASVTKSLPEIFSDLREIEKSDLLFISKPDCPLFLGNLRSGSSVLDVDVFLNGEKALTHHILVSGTTGKGKSIFLSNLLWGLIDKDYCGALVLDPHDEYFGRNKTGLKNHPQKDKVVYYTPNSPPSGANTLTVNLEILKPGHFDGVVNFSDPQKQALNLFYKEFGDKWIESIILEKTLQSAKFRDDTLAVVKRRLLQLLDLDFSNNKLSSAGIFKLDSGFNTINDIIIHLEGGKIVIIDTSNFSGSAELLIGSLVANSVFNKYRYYKMNGELRDKPVVSIVLEEAPRVLGKEVLETGPNIFSTIAREGRKFKVGLCAITQLPSLIPREILANINTKVILGVEMKPERQAIIDSAAQDLSNDDRTIASLDTGEALVTSNFLKFVTPIKIPFFEEVVKKYKEENKGRQTSLEFGELK